MRSDRQHIAWAGCVDQSSLNRCRGIELVEGELVPVGNRAGRRPRDVWIGARISRSQNRRTHRFISCKIYLGHIVTETSNVKIPLLFLWNRASGNRAGHLQAYARNACFRQPGVAALERPRSVSIIGNHPSHRPAESFGNDIFVRRFQEARLKPVDYDFQVGSSLSEELRDKAI